MLPTPRLLDHHKVGPLLFSTSALLVPSETLIQLVLILSVWGVLFCFVFWVVCVCVCVPHYKMSSMSAEAYTYLVYHHIPNT